jgi:hypothetical protein
MKPQLFSLVLSLIPLLCAAQSFQEDFSDGNISHNPTWSGLTDKFSVQQGILRLTDVMPQVSNVSWLSAKAETSLHQETSWEFYVRLELSPSTANFSRYYLSASAADLSTSLNGYFVKIGGINGDNDAVELYRQTGNQLDLLASGQAGAVGLAPAIVRMRVVRTRAGNWQMYADYTGGHNFALAGPSVQDTIHQRGSYTGIYCRYSSTRAQSFYFDDIYIDSLYVDVSPPALLDLRVETSTRVVAVFDERLDSVETQENHTYSLVNYPGSITGTIISDDEIIYLLDSPMLSQQTYILQISGVSDDYGNESGWQEKPFTYLDIRQAERGDVLITEIMADPDPPVRFLPNAEYVEIYNPTTHILDLSSLSLSTGGPAQRLPNQLLFPGQYGIICRADQAERFQAYGMVIPLTNFPAITNSGDDILLVNSAGDTLISLSFDQRWYKENHKTEGGWSLELIAPDRSITCASNWRASTDDHGGTPGRANAVYGLVIDSLGPEAFYGLILSENSVRIFFDEVLNPDQDFQTLISFLNGISVADYSVGPDGQTLDLQTTSTFQPGVSYQIMVSALLMDCLGNTSGSNKLLVTGLPVLPEQGSLVINELLFNPKTGGSDFIELYNASNNFINVRGLKLINHARSTNHQLSVEHDYLIAPGGYVVFTNDVENILGNYRNGGRGLMIEADIPWLDDQFGQVGLYFEGLALDMVEYREEWHHALLDDKNGVSLERLSPGGNGLDRNNWYSAAGPIGFATPGLKNSQYRHADYAFDDITLDHYIFSPDQDGYEDLLVMRYKLDRPGYLMTVDVYDLQGRPVRALAKNELLGSGGLVVWDGFDDSGQICRTGIYFLDIAMFEPGGRVINQRKSCVLTGKSG